MGEELIMYIINDETIIPDRGLYKDILVSVNKANNKGFIKSLFSNKINKEEAKKLHNIKITNNSIDNLEFLKFFPNVEEIAICSCAEIKNISGIRYLGTLKNVFIYNTNIEDLNPIGECTSLEMFEYLIEGVEYRKKLMRILIS